MKMQDAFGNIKWRQASASGGAYVERRGLG